MRKYLIALLMLISCSAWADWVFVVASEDGNARLFIDPNTVRKEGSLRKIWELRNDKFKSKNGAQSFRARVEYDCKNETSKLLSLTEHSGGMASGTVLLSVDSPLAKTSIPPNTIAEEMLKAVCRL